MDKKNVVIAVIPDEYERASRHGLALAHLSYRISPRGRLLRRNMYQRISGGILALDGSSAPETVFSTDLLCSDIIGEVFGRGYGGVLLDFEGEVKKPLAAFATELDRKLAARKIPLYVGREYANAAPKARVLISSEITGGTLSGYLEEQAEKYGKERIALEILPLYMDFLLPTPDGTGKRMTPDALRQLMSKLDPMPFFSRELCAKYFTYMAQDGRAHFVLFDDANTIMAKLKIAQGIGIETAFMLFGEVEAFLNDIWA